MCRETNKTPTTLLTFFLLVDYHQKLCLFLYITIDILDKRRRKGTEMHYILHLKLIYFFKTNIYFFFFKWHILLVLLNYTKAWMEPRTSEKPPLIHPTNVGRTRWILLRSKTLPMSHQPHWPNYYLYQLLIYPAQIT